jgi:hypothetical protein
MCIIFTVFFNVSIVVDLFNIPSLTIVIYGTLNKLKLELAVHACILYNTCDCWMNYLCNNLTELFHLIASIMHLTFPEEIICLLYAL